jgi:hypothetical protein
MDYTNITPEEAKNLIQNAQAEILEQYDEFVNKVSKTSIEESKELIENDEKNNADELLDTLDE